MTGPRPVFTIPAGQPFADRLAAGILAEAGGDPLKLADIRVFLPTRRACRVLRESFLRLTEGQPLLLPRLQPIGDVQDDEPAMLESAAGFSDIPPAMPPLRRQLLLARAIMAAPDLAAPQPEQAMALAAALGRLLDQMHTEGHDIATLQTLVPGDEIHWQVTVKFLKILSEVWPALLAAEGMIDAADRRNRLMRALADAWRTHPPPGRIIAAGTTGSIPATAALLSVIADLPRGAVVLPGLDQVMDDASWDALDDTHPQATLRHLLRQLSLRREDVQVWPAAARDDGRAPRRWLAAETMRPAATSDQWQSLAPGPAIRTALTADLSSAIDLYECPTAQDEARLIAAIIRHTIETPRRTVAVITPDRRLARRIAMVCRRWNVEVDDSGGQSLSASPAGTFMRLALRAVAEQLRPAALLALLRHPLCGLGMDDLPAAAAALERTILRGPKPPPGIEGLRNRIARERAQEGAKDRTIPRAVDQLLDRLQAAIVPLALLLQDTDAQHPLSDFAAAHAATCENLAITPEAPGFLRMWEGDDGDAAAKLIAELLPHGTLMPLNGAQYAQMMEGLCATASVRTPAGLHPRIFILGQLEARLVQADITILASLNEGTWPPDPGHDPWLSRTMRRQAGLPSPERGIGLSAHDFVQGFCAPRVILTRARRVDGAQAVPARWLQRLHAVLQAAQIDPALMLQRTDPAQPPYESLARAMDINPRVTPQERPAPAPPVALRPRSLSVTEIETWLRDPYSIYARHVLRLNKLKDMEKEPDAADRGTLLHDALSDFVANNRQTLPPDAAAQLYDRGVRAVATRADDPGFWEFWLPRYGALCHWFARHERRWRADGFHPEALECKGRMTMPGPAGDFILRVRADRIDRAPGGYAIVDYKSGGADKYTPARILSGHWPQLPLTGLILRQGGMERGIESASPGGSLPPAPIAYMGYWVLTGGSPPGTTKSLTDDIETALQNAADGLAALIAAFDDPVTPYYALPRPDHLPSFNDYDHLARVQEWTALGDGEGAEDTV